MTRRFWLIMLILAAVGVGFWLGWLEPRKRHQEFCQSVRAELSTLPKKRPPGLTRRQWNNVVGWTIQGHSNSLVANWWIPRAEMDRFLTELRERLRGPVTLSTIDWIWNEFERLAPDYGPTYSRNRRPTSPEKLREFEENGGTWLGIDAD